MQLKVLKTNLEMLGFFRLDSPYVAVILMGKYKHLPHRKIITYSVLDNMSEQSEKWRHTVLPTSESFFALHGD